MFPRACERGLEGGFAEGVHSFAPMARQRNPRGGSSVGRVKRGLIDCKLQPRASFDDGVSVALQLCAIVKTYTPPLPPSSASQSSATMSCSIGSTYSCKCKHEERNGIACRTDGSGTGGFGRGSRRRRSVKRHHCPPGRSTATLVPSPGRDPQHGLRIPSIL